MVTTGILPLQEKIPMVEPGIEPGTSWLVVRSSDNQTTRLVIRTHNLSRRAAVYLRLRPRGQWDRLLCYYCVT